MKSESYKFIDSHQQNKGFEIKLTCFQTSAMSARNMMVHRTMVASRNRVKKIDPDISISWQVWFVIGQQWRWRGPGLENCWIGSSFVNLLVKFG